MTGTVLHSSLGRGIVALSGDLVIFAVFPLLGSAEHGTEVGSASFVRVFVPFAVAWTAVGLIARAFAPSVVASLRRTMLHVAPAWLAAGILAIVLRTTVFDREFVLAFAIVAISVAGGLLLAWRLVLAAVLSRAGRP